MNKIKGPIIVVDKRGYDIGIHPSPEEMQSHLEAADVINDEYVAYDAEGRLLTLGVVKKKRPILSRLLKADVDHVVIQQAEDQPSHSAKLRAALTEFMDRTGTPIESIENLSLDRLIQEAAKRTITKKGEPQKK